MNRCRVSSKRYTAMERCPSFAFFSGLGPTMKDAVTTNLHLKCCPARPPEYMAWRFLHTNPSAFPLCIFFPQSRLAFVVIAYSPTRQHALSLQKCCVSQISPDL